MFANTKSIFNPDSPAGSVILQVIAGVLLVLVLAVASWVSGPTRWLRDNYRLRRFLVPKRRFRMVFNPSGHQEKIVTFEEAGQIGEGQNRNETFWRIRRGKLEILAADGDIYSRFRYDRQSGMLVHTNDSDCRSILGQYFEPQWQSMQQSMPKCSARVAKKGSR